MRSTTTLIALAGLLLESTAAAATNCSVLELIIARGTDEPLKSSFGEIVGDPLFATTQALIPGVTGYSVDYPASLCDSSPPLGAADVLSHLTTASAACPAQKYVLVGYSQGAEVMHFAASKLPTSVFPRIVALVMYGDPANPGPSLSAPPRIPSVPAFAAALNQKLKENCATGDPVCSDGTVVKAHLSYDSANTTYIADSAAYIQQQFASGGTVGPQLSPNGGDSPAAEAALTSLFSLLGTAGGSSGSHSSSKCPAAPSSSSSTGSAATTTTTGSSTSLSSGASAAGSASATFTGGAMRLSPLGFLY